MIMQLVKAEILWTRKCPLSCSYCNMATGLPNSRSLRFWKRGLDQLKQLGCPFIAIYGAEPLADFEKLPEFVHHSSNIGLDMTVITILHDEEKLRILYENGLRSLTTSYDIIPLDKWSKIKSDRAIKLLEAFRSFGPVDNVAVVVTLTRQNYKYLYDTTKQMTDQGIWLFFDIIHPDRGQIGSKAKGCNADLLFREEDIPSLISELSRILKHRDELMVHASKSFFESIVQDPELAVYYLWNCADYDCFPSWVTVNCDGLVYPCDDFQPRVLGIPFDKLAEKWSKLPELWKRKTQRNCPGCFWNTHLDAHHIKQGREDITGYVHRKE